MPGVKGRSGGRNKKPLQLHVLQGSFNATRHATWEPTPEPPAGLPDARGLRGEAKAEWDRMIKRLSAVGTLSLVDDAALRRYVRLHALAERLEASALRLHGEALRKALTQVRQVSMALKAWLVEFGMTPASRVRVKASLTPARAATTVDPKRSKYLGRLDKA